MVLMTDSGPCLSRRNLCAMVLLLPMLAGVPLSRAQCSAQWIPGFGAPGLDMPVVYATTIWDPDGPGPLTPRVVVGGYFPSAGNVPASSIATYDPATGQWSALGSGLGDSGYFGKVYALTTLPNGDLVAGGRFDIAGGMTVNNIARWNGTSWSALGSGISQYGSVYALTTLPNGDLVAGGQFGTAGSVLANHIARWNGTAWSALGSGMGQYGNVYALTTLPNGDLVAGGQLDYAGGVAVNNIARWNGTAWSALGSGIINPGYVFALATLPNGDLVAGGQFTTAGANNIASWNGSAWSALGSGLHGSPYALITLPNGELVAGGQFDITGVVGANSVARWDGTAWFALGSGLDGSVSALATLPNGDLVAEGGGRTAGGVTVNGIACWTFGGAAVTITTQPAPAVLVPGGTATFAVSVDAIAPAFRWRHNGVDLADGARISGSAAATLMITAVQPSDEGEYDCVVTNLCDSLTSNPAALSCDPMLLGQPPQHADLDAGLQLAVTVPPGAPYSYRWRQDGQNLFNFPGWFSGVTTKTLTILTVDPSLAGTYDCVLTDVCGTTVSSSTEVSCPSDFNRDGFVDPLDYNEYINAFETADMSADFNGDGFLDPLDYNGFINAFESGC